MADNALDVARRQCGLSQDELWIRYFALGGMTGALEMEGVVYGALEATAHDRDLMVHALNERFSELGGGHPLPYADDPDEERRPWA